jgi:hypothetical protein
MAFATGWLVVDKAVARMHFDNTPIGGSLDSGTPKPLTE